MAESIPPMMKAVCIREPGGPAVLRMIDVPLPRPGPSEVLIRVAAAGVNRPDVLQRLGRYPVPPGASPLPGLEAAGEIVAVGSDVSRWQAGDAVMALTHGGGYAEFCVADGSHCLPVPAGFSFVEAAAIPETFFTVWYNVFTRCRLEAGETFMVHGGSSGIGTTAIQLARAYGCTVLTTAGSDEKCRFCERLGADRAFNYVNDDWQAGVREQTGDRGVDVLLDMVAGPYTQKNLECLARDGRYAIIAFLKGPRAEVDLRVVLANRLTVTGSTLRPQSVAEKARIAADVERNVLPLLESGRVRPIIHATFPLDAAPAAHELMESSRHMGKIVLTMRETAHGGAA
ncbi:MAG TPA: NAD(P)H-quinone oxidoreductase [Woeseiaceae bacterium]|nr:NAD(P)H-quinone oxidoreductase [Woeseiaceae bacterium]